MRACQKCLISGIRWCAECSVCTCSICTATSFMHQLYSQLDDSVPGVAWAWNQRAKYPILSRSRINAALCVCVFFFFSISSTIWLWERARGLWSDWGLWRNNLGALPVNPLWVSSVSVWAYHRLLSCQRASRRQERAEYLH